MMNSHTHLRWCCRRGMLELDVILGRFLDQGYSQLTPTEQQTFERLLSTPDPDLFAWLIGKAIPEDEELAHLVTTIRAVS